MVLDDLAGSLVDALDRYQRAARTYTEIREALEYHGDDHAIAGAPPAITYQLRLPSGATVQFDAGRDIDVVKALTGAGAYASQTVCLAWAEILEIATRGKAHCDKCIAAAEGTDDGQEETKTQEKEANSVLKEGTAGGDAAREAPAGSPPPRPPRA